MGLPAKFARFNPHLPIDDLAATARIPAKRQFVPPYLAARCSSRATWQGLTAAGNVMIMACRIDRRNKTM
jgi:hypothetical protein